MTGKSYYTSNFTTVITCNITVITRWQNPLLRNNSAVLGRNIMYYDSGGELRLRIRDASVDDGELRLRDASVDDGGLRTRTGMHPWTKADYASGTHDSVDDGGLRTRTGMHP